MPTEKKKEQLAVGHLGEQLVAHWLHQQRWKIVARGWHSRWGELDIIALRTKEAGEECLAFVEVKTRGRRNWDADGLLAITPSKQAKLWKTAQAFLSKHQHWAELPCRFDVALVQYLRRPLVKATDQTQVADQSLFHSSTQTELRSPFAETQFPRELALGETINISHYALTLVTYIEAAFSG